MPMIFPKNELFELYNALGCSLLDFADDDEDEHSEAVSNIIKATQGIENKISDAYQGLEDGSSASIKLSAEEALIVVRALIADIKENENLIGSEDDPTSHHAERAYYMRNLKERIQGHFREKFYDLWFLSDA